MRKLFTFFVVLTSAFVLTGCAIIGGGSDTTQSGGGMMPGIPTQEDVRDTATVESKDRSVIVNASAYITADRPDEAVESILKLVEKEKGFIDQKNINTDANGKVESAYLVVRIPAPRLDTVLVALNDVGKVETSQISSSDVTLSVRDLEARAKALQVSVGRLLELLNSATKTSDLVEIESALSQRQAELDSIKSTLDYYKDAIDISTLSIEIAGPEVAPGPEPDNFWEAIVAGWVALTAFLAGSVIAIGIAIPWLVMTAVTIGLIILIWRLIARTRK
jgi:hypothetical protein